jgi:hypothetical protein
MKPRTLWACQPVVFVMDGSSSLDACAAGTDLSFWMSFQISTGSDSRQITQNNARRGRSEPSKTLTRGDDSAAFPELRHVRIVPVCSVMPLSFNG